MEQVASAFQSLRIGTSDSNPELVVLLEVTVPESEAWMIRLVVVGWHCESDFIPDHRVV